MKPEIAWNLDPTILFALTGYITIYTWRWRQVRREQGNAAASTWRLASFSVGVLMLFGALIKPSEVSGFRRADRPEPEGRAIADTVAQTPRCWR